jgi:hypothetical protein
MHTIRRSNLLRLLRDFTQVRISSGEPTNGTERLFAEQLQMSKSLLSHLKSARPISDAIAKQIEARCRKPNGWLSIEHVEIQTRPALGEDAFVALARETYRAADRAERVRLRAVVSAFSRGT